MVEGIPEFGEVARAPTRVYRADRERRLLSKRVVKDRTLPISGLQPRPSRHIPAEAEVSLKAELRLQRFFVGRVGICCNQRYSYNVFCNSRLFNCTNSATKPAVSSPDIVAASISVVSRIDVATSALHSKQYLSLLPGSSNNSVRRLQTAHCKGDGSAQVFGPDAIRVPPMFRAWQFQHTAIPC